MNANRQFKAIGVIGDVHAENNLLEKAIEFLRLQKVEEILCVGDIVDGHGNANQCCEILEREGIQVVLGNHDRWLLTNQMRDLKTATPLDALSESSRSFLSSLPKIHEFCTVRGPALLCHGLDENDMARLTPDDCGYAIEVNQDLQNLRRSRKYKYVINGHTHYRMVRKFGELTIINAGTLKRNRDPVFLLVDFLQGFVKFYRFVRGSEIEEAEKVSV